VVKVEDQDGDDGRDQAEPEYASDRSFSECHEVLTAVTRCSAMYGKFHL
jgi:hypothetical protein